MPFDGETGAHLLLEGGEARLTVAGTVYYRGRSNTHKAGRGTDLQMKYAVMKLEAEIIAYIEVCGEYVNALFKPVII